MGPRLTATIKLRHYPRSQAQSLLRRLGPILLLLPAARRARQVHRVVGGLDHIRRHGIGASRIVGDLFAADLFEVDARFVGVGYQCRDRSSPRGTPCAAPQPSAVAYRAAPGSADPWPSGARMSCRICLVLSSLANSITAASSGIRDRGSAQSGSEPTPFFWKPVRPRRT